mmetsp:Transcript_20149/g.30229  ORF Transcript_20149/g.30229 Transcript_20149/m.30229 type:complete len:316 (-) Transcript_20149:2257-3204(-)
MFHQQQSNSSNYQLPSWSKRPRDGDEWCLEEIKNGVVVQKHKLDLPVITFGRTPLHLPTNSSKSTCTSDGSDSSSRAFKSVLTAHESCSRLHARIAFDSTGTPWLRDLGSGNGTTINKKKLPPQSIGRQESTTTVTTTTTTTTALQVPSKTREKEGSRGVILFPGDVVQFGASTRIYVVQGPSYFDRGAVKARKQQRQQQQQQQKTVPKKTKKKSKKGGKKLGGAKSKDKGEPKIEEDDDLDDLAFLDAQIEQVQNSHGRKVEGTGKGYKSIVNGILLAKPKPQEKKRDTRAVSALTAKLKEAQTSRKPKSKKKK